MDESCIVEKVRNKHRNKNTLAGSAMGAVDKATSLWLGERANGAIESVYASDAKARALIVILLRTLL